MRRRTVLAVAATAVTGVSGCLAGGDGAGNGSGGDTDGTGDTDGNGDGAGGGGDGSGDCSDGGDCGPAEVTSASISTTDTGCGTQGADDASANLEGETLTIEGTIGASDPCHEAVLGGTAVEDGQLTVSVGLEATGGVCTQCIGEIDYRATLEVANVYGLEGVTVDHTDAGEHTFSMDEITSGS